MSLFLLTLLFSSVFKGTCAKPVQCDSATIALSGERATVTFSNGLSFTGARIGGDGPLFLSDAVMVDGKAAQPPPNSSCRFYFTDHGTFTDGWERRLVAVECDRINFKVTP